MKQFVTLALCASSFTALLGQCNATIPNDAFLFGVSGSAGGSDVSVFVCSFVQVMTDTDNSTIYAEDLCTVLVDGDDNVIIAQACSLLITGDNNVVHTTAASVVSNSGINNTVLICPSVDFDYSAAPDLTFCALGMAEPKWAEQLSLSPVPTPDQLTIRSDGSPLVAITLYDAQGRRMRAISASGGMASLDLRTCASGTYLVEVATDQGTVRRWVTKL